MHFQAKNTRFHALNEFFGKNLIGCIYRKETLTYFKEDIIMSTAFIVIGVGVLVLLLGSKVPAVNKILRGASNNVDEAMKIKLGENSVSKQKERHNK